MELKEITAKVQKLKGNRKIVACYLFGSYLKNPKKANDVDVCFLTKDMDIFEMAKVGEKLEKPFDVSFMERMPNYNAFNVFRDGTPLFINDRKSLAKKWMSVVSSQLEHVEMKENIARGMKSQGT